MSRHARPPLLRRVNARATAYRPLHTALGVGALLGLVVPPTVAWGLSTAPQPRVERIDAIPVQTSAPPTTSASPSPGALAPVFDQTVALIDPTAEASGYASPAATATATPTPTTAVVTAEPPTPAPAPTSAEQPPPVVEPTVPTVDPTLTPEPEPTPEPPADPTGSMVDDLSDIVDPPTAEETTP